MTIRTMIRLSGLGFAIIALCGAFFAGLNINNIRMGGPIQTRDSEISSLVADIMPPPAFLAEAYLEVSLLNHHPDDLPEHRERLAAMEKSYRERMQFWGNAHLPQDISDALTGDADKHGQRFWDIVNTGILPAFAAGDRPAAARGYEAASAQYIEHRKAVEDAVARSLHYQQTLKTNGEQELQQSLITLVGLAIALGLLLTIAVRMLLARVLTPVADTASAMQAMADGNLDVALDVRPGKNEIGTMVEAFEVFRESARARRVAEQEILEGRRDQEKVLNALGSALGQLAEGRLDARLGDDIPPAFSTLRCNFNAAMESIGGILQDVAHAADGVRMGSSEISAASSDLAVRTEHQAARLEETAAAMTQISQTVQETADTLDGANQTVSVARGDAAQGGDVARRAVAAMGRIESSSQQISEIINVIDGIAFQTNLLALNAGVEAARAGDAGKGFAVVANEVRALAQRSADAAKDIKGLIGESVQEVEAGVRLVAQTGEALDRIVSQIGTISGMIDTVSMTSREQAEGVNQVSQAVSDMDQSTQQNAAMVEQSTAAARSLAAEADRLAELVSRFQTGKPGATASARPQARPSQPPAGRAAAPRVAGNLALAEEDWTDF